MLADVLGAYCAGLSAGDLPAEVVESAKIKILDTLGCAFAAAPTETAGVLKDYSRRYAPKGAVALWGRGRGAPALDAAFINGTAAHALLHDDTDLESGHVACMVVPAALAAAGAAIATHTRLNGAEVLAGIVLGYEVMWRASGCGKVVTGALGRGFRGYVINGALGAVAASGRIMGLGAEQHRNALSCAANTISGLLEPVGVASIERAIMAGTNARTGLQSALLAKSGLVGTASILEGAQGYFRAVGGITGADVDTLTRDLGRSHRILASLYKIYPSAGANQSAIYAAEEAVRRHSIDIAAIQSVRLWQYPLFGDAVPVDGGKPAYPSIISTGPYTSIEETLPNKPFGVSSMLANGRFDIAILRAGLNSPRIETLAKKVSSSGRPSFGPLEAEIEIALADGRRILESVDCAKEPRFYPRLRDMPARMLAICAGCADIADFHRLADAVDGLDRRGGLESFLKLLGVMKVAKFGVAKRKAAASRPRSAGPKRYGSG